jgi:mono/diheme cytochrome c family protein
MFSLIYTVIAVLATAAAQTVSPGAYAGAKACATCHSDIAARQAASRHAKTWRPPGGGFPESYRVDLPGNGRIEIPVKMMLGGDRFGLSFVLEMKKLGDAELPRTTLIEARRMHSARLGTLVLSPGFPAAEPESYATAIGRVLSPTFAKKCLACHGAPRETGLDTGVRCESCHGPGRDHIAAVGKKSRDLRIENPGKLTGEGFLNVCARCHAGFSPLSDPRPDDLLISSQVTALKSSG